MRHHGQGFLGRGLSQRVLKHGFVEGVTDHGMEAFVLKFAEAGRVPGDAGHGVSCFQKDRNEPLRHIAAGTDHEH